MKPQKCGANPEGRRQMEEYKAAHGVLPLAEIAAYHRVCWTALVTYNLHFLRLPIYEYDPATEGGGITFAAVAS